MPTTEPNPDAPFTLTHARLRAAQGDLEAAGRILRAMLRDEPGNLEAKQLLATLAGPARARRRAEGRPGGREAALRRWLEAIGRKRGQRRDAR